MQVTGHFGWITGDWIFAPNIRMSLPDMLKAGLDVFVTKQPPRATYRPIGVLDRIRQTNPSSRAGVFLMQCRDDRARRS
jgi:hypothetical protein